MVQPFFNTLKRRSKKLNKNFSLNKTVEIIINVALILLGNTILAFGAAAFVIPNNLVSGGSTGLSLFANHAFGIDITLFISIFNPAMFILGFIMLGKKFALTTLISSFYYPFILGVFRSFPALTTLSDDKLLSCIYAGLLLGVGVGLVLRMGASTGGMDIPPLVLNKKLGFSLSVTIYAFDTLILLSQIPFSSSQEVLYGIIVVLLTSLTINQILLIGQKQTQVMVISEKHEEINELIHTQIDRGSTLLRSISGYKKEEQQIVFTVISHRELLQLKNLVMSIDPKAFMIISQVNEVKGRGFTLDKHD